MNSVVQDHSYVLDDPTSVVDAETMSFFHHDLKDSLALSGQLDPGENSYNHYPDICLYDRFVIRYACNDGSQAIGIDPIDGEKIKQIVVKKKLYSLERQTSSEEQVRKEEHREQPAPDPHPVMVGTPQFGEELSLFWNDEFAVIQPNQIPMSNSTKDELKTKYKFRMSKDIGKIEYHLGLNFTRDDRALRLEPKKFIKRLVDSYKRLFGSKPKHATSQLKKGDHPELDTSELLEFVCRYWR